MPREQIHATPAERQAAYRARKAEPARKPLPPAYDDNDPFWRAFPARPNDLAPTPAQLKALGLTLK